MRYNGQNIYILARLSNLASLPVRYIYFPALYFGACAISSSIRRKYRAGYSTHAALKVSKNLERCSQPERKRYVSAAAASSTKGLFRWHENPPHRHNPFRYVIFVENTYLDFITADDTLNPARLHHYQCYTTSLSLSTTHDIKQKICSNCYESRYATAAAQTATNKTMRQLRL